MARETDEKLTDKPSAWVDLALTLPIFVAYHLAVVFLGVQNATDMVTGQLLRLSEGNRAVYMLFTLAIGTVFAGIFAALGRGHAFRVSKFIQIAVEGVVYAIAMRVLAAYAVGRLFAGPIKDEGPLVGFVMSLGAGFYEELAFRAVLFGLGAKALVWLFAGQRVTLVGSTSVAYTIKSWAILAAWAVACAFVFSAVHYVGAMGDDFTLTSFAFRALLGLALTFIFATRGFAAAVWTHTAYDIWVLVFR